MRQIDDTTLRRPQRQAGAAIQGHSTRPGIAMISSISSILRTNLPNSLYVDVQISDPELHEGEEGLGVQTGFIDEDILF